MKKKLLLMLLVVAALSPFAAAAEIEINNFGFEARTMKDAAFAWWRTNYNPDSWYGVDLSGNGTGDYKDCGGRLMQWNPGNVETYDGLGRWATNGLGGEAAEGENTIVVNRGEFFGGAGNLLTATFDHTKTYRLTAKVAIPSPYSGIGTEYGWGSNVSSYWKGYALEILAGGAPNKTDASYSTIEGGTRVAYIEKTKEECNFAPETFYEVSLTYTPDEAYASLDGQPIQIRIIAGVPLDGERTNACFDDVHLYEGQLNAGPDVAAWSAQPVTMAADYGDTTPASILWTADPNSDPNYTVSISDPAAENPTVTVTKLNALAPEVLKIKMTVLVDGTDSDDMTITVYDTACQAAIAGGLKIVGDVDEDCNIGIGDVAMMAESWLLNTEVTSWEPE